MSVRVKRGPYVTSHAVSEFQQHIYDCPNAEVVSMILTGYYSGKIVFTGDNTKMIKASFKYDIEAVIVVNIRRTGDEVIKTILTMKEYHNNTS